MSTWISIASLIISRVFQLVMWVLLLIALWNKEFGEAVVYSLILIVCELERIREKYEGVI